jgi:hypothetical protein
LFDNKTVGISTGGVAEIFETNSSVEGDEFIVLKSRKGLVKLAFSTGASLVPCYLFGNTHLFGIYSGGQGVLHCWLRNISRRIGGALVVFWGRMLLPIPYRVPIVGVMAAPISVPLKETPTDDEIDAVHDVLMQKMVTLFDEHKHAYGWGSKKLIIM